MLIRTYNIPRKIPNKFDIIVYFFGGTLVESKTRER
jgi:hypothetical protein